MKADIGVAGLAVMGRNLALNIRDRGYIVAVYNRSKAKTHSLLAEEGERGLVGAFDIAELAHSLSRPRKIIMMVKAGEAVDALIESLLSNLEEGDILIDGGNSLYTDSQRRFDTLSAKGILYVGSGISGGEEGARFGPSLMPGGNPQAWPLIKDIFQSIAAKTEKSEACCDWVGSGGAGHYVKMIHNAIEYADMQLICETYHLLKSVADLEHDKMTSVFSEWNRGELKSYLIEITADILSRKENGEPLVEKILDRAGQKGTGKWTGINALEMGVPASLLVEAVFARSLAAMKDERIEASAILPVPSLQKAANKDEYIEEVRKALLASKVVAYAQGFMMMKEASRLYGWNLNFGGIALMWRGGCIIRSVFLERIKEAFDRKPGLRNLLLDDYFKETLGGCSPSWRKTIAGAVSSGIPTPAFSSALSFYDGYGTERLPANLLQGQRDYFGAHTFERTDRPRGEFFHYEWMNKEK